MLVSPHKYRGNLLFPCEKQVLCITFIHRSEYTDFVICAPMKWGKKLDESNSPECSVMS